MSLTQTTASFPSAAEGSAPETEVSVSALLSLVTELYIELHHSEPAPGAIGLASRLEQELGLDSLGRVELFDRAGRQFGRHLPDEALASIQTVANLLDALGKAPATTTAVTAHTTPGQEAAALRAAARDLDVPAEARTLIEVLHWHAEQHPDVNHATLIQESGSTALTYEGLRAGALQVASGLVRAGIEPADTIALMMPTSVDYLQAFFGTLLAGAIPVPIYPPTRPAQLEEHVMRHAGILENADARALITSPEARTVAHLIRSGAGTVRHIWSLEELKRTGTPFVPAAPTETQIALLQYTSGSTGAPKGVILTHANLLANIRAIGKFIHASSTDVFVSWLPLYHDMGLIGAWLGSLYFGCPLVLMPPVAFLTRPVRWLRAIHEYRGTLTASPNFGYEFCARKIDDRELEGIDLSSLRLALNGAEPVEPDTLDRFARRYHPYGLRPATLMPVYGLAEAAVGLAFPPVGREPRVDSVSRTPMLNAGRALPAGADQPSALRFVSCGRALPGYDIRICDPAGNELPERSEGTLQFKGPSATEGYYRHPDATARLFKDGWLDSGDRAYIAAGEIYITGRVKDIIIRRGRHVYPEEIEHVVGELEGVRRGCVVAFGTRDPTTATERLVILAETRVVGSAGVSELKSRVNDRVVQLLGEPPEEIVLAPPHTVLKTSSGKLRRAATRTAYENGSLWRAPASPALQILRLSAHNTLLALRRRLQAGAHIAYGSYVWCLFALLGLPAVLATLAARDPERAWRFDHRMARILLRASGVPVQIERDAGARLERPHVIVANHCSYVDSIVIAAAIREPHRFVAKGELGRSALRGFLNALGTLFVERSQPLESTQEVERLAAEVRRGSSLVVFPEGTFTHEAGVRGFHLGAFQVAAAAGVPVVPATLRGTRSILRDGSWMPRRGSVSVVLGSPIELEPTEDPFTAAVKLRDTARLQIVRHSGEPPLDLSG